jgi:hypothetical protein
MSQPNYLTRPLRINNGIWGSGTWCLLHSLSFTYPNNPSSELITKTLNFLTNLRLPCSECETNYVNYINSNPPTLNSRSDFVDWVINFRNSDRIFRGLSVFSKDQVINYYEKCDELHVYLNLSVCATCSTTSN